MPDISTYLVNDSYRPPVPKRSLQQYDNYQIYDLHCIDITSEKIRNGTREVEIKEKINMLAVQAYSPHIILCDFNHIVQQYQ